MEEATGPRRLAPYTFALTADVLHPDHGDDPVATGRLVLLHDPAGHEAWHGKFRLVTYVRGDLEPEMGGDPLLLAVGWSWLEGALDEHGAEHTAISGTVTRVSSESFGTMAGDDPTTEVEIRASWTPMTTELTAHAAAWADTLTAAAGLQPLPAGVVALPLPRTSEPDSDQRR